jgi:hypothetical protein
VHLNIDYLSGFTMPYKNDFNNEIPLCAKLALSFIFIVDQLHDSAIFWKAMAFFDGAVTKDAFATTDRFGFNDVLN